MGPHRRSPSHIVVFRETAGRNSSLMSRILGVGEAAGARARSGTVLLRARTPGSPPPRIYERLGVAVADLDDGQVGRLRRQDSVGSVVPNDRLAVPACAVGSAGAGVLPAGAAAREAPVPPARSWCLDMIGLTEHDRRDGRGVTVAVLDTGVDLEHPDLAERFRSDWSATSFVPGEGPHDGHGHGTHCVGLVAGPRSSTGGVRYGVAPGATVLAGKVLNDAGVGSCDWIIDGIDWAVEKRARVISLSCISSRDAGQAHSAVYERVAQSLLCASPGALLVAAAGNSSARPWYARPVDNPGACPSLLSVAAVQSAGRVASFSARQMDEIGTIDVSAPGVGVRSAWTGGGFRALSGTSMAVPHVAGIAALYLEAEPSLCAVGLRRALRERAKPLGDVRDFGSGLVQARRPAGVAATEGAGP